MNSTSLSDFRHASFRGRIGISRIDITPPVGIYCRNWGASKHDLAAAVHRPLTLTALALSPISGEQTLVFVDADLGWWRTPQTFQRFHSRLLKSPALKSLALKSPALESKNLLFALSHTHSGPPLMEPDESLPGNAPLQDWMESLFDSTVNAIRIAQEEQFDAILDWQIGRCGLASNRDFPDPDEKRNRVICGYNPGGESDDTLLVGRVTDDSGTLRATLTNYACHPTTLAWENSAISPDYIGSMRDTIQQTTGVPSLFMLGACGDLAPRYQYVSDTTVADRHGEQLAYATLSTLAAMEPPATALAFAETVESGASLAVWKHQAVKPSEHLRSVQTSVELPLKNWPSAEQLEQERLNCTDRALEERLRRKRNIRRGIGDGTTFQLPIYVWRIGDAVLVGSCCEPYSVLQQTLRSRFADRTIICMNLINGSIGYLPPADVYDTEIYPVWQTPFDRGSLELTIEAMTGAVRDVLTD